MLGWLAFLISRLLLRSATPSLSLILAQDRDVAEGGADSHAMPGQDDDNTEKSVLPLDHGAEFLRNAGRE